MQLVMLNQGGAAAVTLGEYVRNRRVRLGKTQREIAKIADWDQSKLSRIERDQGAAFPEPDELRRLADALECTFDELLAAAGYVEQNEAGAEDTDRATVYTHVQNSPDLTDHEKRFILNALDEARRRRREIEAFERERGGNG